MIVDARKMPNGEVLRCDVCIAGAGAAGITLAREFTGKGFEVILLESGGLEFDDETDALSVGKIIGHPHGPLNEVRLRYFGGTTNHWGGWCRPFDEIDFEARDWVAHSGWPLQKTELDPYYVAAHEYCQIGKYNYDIDYWAKKIQDSAAKPLRIPNLTSLFFQFSPPTRFGETYRDALAQAPNVRVFLNANVTSIHLRPDAASVDSVDARTLQGNTFSVTPKIFVLATGGIENPRLLLASDDVAKHGVGNQHDLVGRYYMEHPHIDAGQLLLSANRVGTDLYDRGYTYGNLRVGASLSLVPAIQRQEKLLNSRVDLNAFYEGDASEGTKALKRVYRSIRQGEMPDRLMESLGAIIGDIDDVAAAVYGHSTNKVKFANLKFNMEQAPNRDSRILLDSSRDAIGLRRVVMDWRLLEADRNSLIRTLDRVARAFGAKGLGRVKKSVGENLNDWLDNRHSGWHHMGTTRMSNDPKSGVVDRNCKIHGVQNLYVAGSSVFPTGGAGVPTLTIVALAVRLAAHIRKQVGA